MAQRSDSSEPPRWGIVVGGSAGALQPVRDIVSQLEPELPAAIFVVQHTAPGRRGHLASVLGRASALPVQTPGFVAQAIREGVVYVASPDRHLVVGPNGVHVTRGPREHHTRPAVDVLFRSAARVFGSRTIAIVLSGYGGDGATGTTAVHVRGGTVIAQAPDEAEAPSMPLRAVQTGHVDHVLPVSSIPGMLGRIIGRQRALSPGAQPMEGPEERVRQRIANDIRQQEAGERNAQVSTVVCPDCGGILWQDQQGGTVDFTCHIGHRWTSDTLIVQKTEQLEAALLASMRLLKEKGMLLHQAAARARDQGKTTAAERLAEQAALDERYADVIQRELLETESSPLSDAALDEEVSAPYSNPPDL